MRPSIALRENRQTVREIVLNHRVSSVRVFGSVLHGCDAEGSDLDLLVFPTDKTTLFDLARIKGGLEALLGVSVDVLTPNSLPEKFRDQVLTEAQEV